MSLVAIVLTKNEQENIQACLSHLEWADKRIVVDSGSADETCAIAQRQGAEIGYHSFKDFSAQRNFSMTLVPDGWILFIDADERVSAELAEEIQKVIKESPAVYSLPRHNYFFGKRLKYSGSAEDAPVRLFPRDSGVWVQPVHEYFKSDLPVHKLKNPLMHHTTRNLSHYLEKIERYVPLEVETMRLNGRRPSLFNILFRPLAKFVYLYIIKWGILDGWVGFQFAALSSYYDFKKYALFAKMRRS